MHILIIGASGMTGHLITTYLKEKGYTVSTLSGHHPFDEQTVLIDLCDTTTLKDYLTNHHFDIIINCAGILIKDCETHPLRAILVNSYLPHYLETLYRYTETRIIHLSTDCVFSGTSGPYIETAPYDGTLFYDRTKALGELNNAKDLTFRMSIIGPDKNPHGIGLLNWFLQQEGTLSGYTHSYWNGITTLELAKAIEAAIKQNLSGLYHLVPSEVITKFELLNLFKHTFNRSNLTIIPTCTPISNKILINTRTDFNYKVASYPIMLKELAKWIEKHPNLYSHYM